MKAAGTESRRRLAILDEKIEQRGGDSDGGGENPYWAEEEEEAHPAPEKGCVRRGLCCKSSPGWFAPGEVEAAAALVGMTPDAFVRAYVVIDHHHQREADGARVEAFVPVKLDRQGVPLRPPGTRVDRLYRMFRGPCIFYQPIDSLGGGSPGEPASYGCRIYAARPIECSRYLCVDGMDGAPPRNIDQEEIARMWQAGTPPAPGARERSGA